jgi:hypothetical protein
MGSVKVSHGDGTVVSTGRPAPRVPAPRPSSLPVPPQPGRLHRSGGHGHLSRLLGRSKALAVPPSCSARCLAGPDNTTVFGNNVERVPDSAERCRSRACSAT